MPPTYAPNKGEAVAFHLASSMCLQNRRRGRSDHALILTSVGVRHTKTLAHSMHQRQTFRTMIRDESNRGNLHEEMQHVCMMRRTLKRLNKQS